MDVVIRNDPTYTTEWRVCCDGMTMCCWVVIAPIGYTVSVGKDSIGSHCNCYPLNGNFGVVPITPFFYVNSFSSNENPFCFFVRVLILKLKEKKRCWVCMGSPCIFLCCDRCDFLFFVLVWLSVPGNVPLVLICSSLCIDCNVYSC